MNVADTASWNAKVPGVDVAPAVGAGAVGVGQVIGIGQLAGREDAAGEPRYVLGRARAATPRATYVGDSEIAKPGILRQASRQLLSDGPIQAAAIGNQFAGRVGFFLRVDDFDAAHQRMTAAGVEFVSGPRTEPYGRIAVFADIAGNRWDLLGPRLS